MSGNPAWMPWAVILPLAGAICSSYFARIGVALALVASVATASSTLRIAAETWAHGIIRHRVAGWGAPLGIELRSDGTSAVILLAFGVVGVLVTFYALVYFPPGPRRRVFLTIWLFAWAALDALLVSNDLFNLYVTLELLTLTAVALIVLERRRAAVAAGFRYLVLALVGSVGYLVGVSLLYAAHATLDIGLLERLATPSDLDAIALALITVGLGLKSALFPLHAWLPPAYVNAPPPATAVLSGLLGKAPFLVLMRVWPALGVAADHPAAAHLIGALAGASILWASLVALQQRRLTGVIAYSSVAHVGYMFLFFPLGSAMARDGVVYLAISHAAASAALFTAAGTVEMATGSDTIAGLRGVAHRRPLAFFAIGIAGASLMGLPPSGGFIAKWLLVRSAIERGQWWLAIVILAGGLIAAGYVFRILRVAFLFSTPEDERDLRPGRPGSDAVPLALALASLLLGIVPSWPLLLLERGSL